MWAAPAGNGAGKAWQFIWLGESSTKVLSVQHICIYSYTDMIIGHLFYWCNQSQNSGNYSSWCDSHWVPCLVKKRILTYIVFPGCIVMALGKVVAYRQDFLWYCTITVLLLSQWLKSWKIQSVIVNCTCLVFIKKQLVSVFRQKHSIG